MRHGKPFSAVSTTEVCRSAASGGQASWHRAALPVRLGGMRIDATSLDAIRHRLLEGVLLRLARRADVDQLIVRGGVLLRHWFRPLPRVADDLDLVAIFPFDPTEVTRRLPPLLTDDVADGVTFDAERVRVEAIYLETGSPSVRVFASGMIEDSEADFHIDVAFGPFPRPAPVLSEIPTECGRVARVNICRPECVAGQKVQALCHLGMLNWRPKDLHDLRLLLTRVPLEAAALREAIAAYLADLRRGGDDARALFAPSSWWGMKRSTAHWSDFVKASRGQDVPRDLASVVAEIACRLTPVLEGLP